MKKCGADERRLKPSRPGSPRKVTIADIIAIIVIITAVVPVTISAPARKGTRVTSGTAVKPHTASGLNSTRVETSMTHSSMTTTTPVTATASK